MNPPAPQRRILIIDDAEAIHLDFRRILAPEQPRSRGELDVLQEAVFGPGSTASQESTQGFEVDSAFQGQEGLARVSQALASGRPYDLVFLDYRMPPGWNGAETLRRLKAVAPGLPVVLCSAYSDYSWTELLAEFGHSPLLRELRKPFNRQEVRRLAAGEGRAAGPGSG